MIALARLLTLLALVCLAAAALDPVVTVFADRPAPEAVVTDATDAWHGAAVAGPRAEDLALSLGDSHPVVPDGSVGAQVVSERAPLLFDPEALELRSLRAPAVDRPVALSLVCLDGALDLVADVTVVDGERELLAETVALSGGRPAELEFVPAQHGPVRVRVEVEAGGLRVAREGQLTIGPAAPVLVLDPSGVAAPALRAQGVAIERAVAMTSDLSRYAAVVVGAPLTLEMQQILVAAVDDGLGAFVLAPAFGNRGEPLHKLLPVVPELPDEGEGSAGGAGGPGEPAAVLPPDPQRPPAGEIRDPSMVSPDTIEVDKRTIAMVLVVDRSGSMGIRVASGRTKMSYAKTSALDSATALAEGDQVGIVTFGNKGAGRVELPLTDANEAQAILDGVERLAYGPEYTSLLSGLQKADALLRAADTAVKHVVVITDGEFDTSETVALRALAHRMFRDARISVTILSIVSGRIPSGFKSDAEAITRDGGGEFFAIEAAESVPVFVSAEVTRSLDRAGRGPGSGSDPETTDPPVPEPPHPEPEPDPPEQPEPSETRLPVRAVASSPVLEPQPADWPTLGAAVATTAPLDTQVLLVAGDQGWPLLCYGNRGLGRIGAFAADLCGDAGQQLRAEAAFPARLALWVQHVMRSQPFGKPRLVELATTIEPGAPTPKDVAAIERLGGAPLARAVVQPTATVVRSVRSLLPDWALLALAVLVLLVLVERVAVLRGRS